MKFIKAIAVFTVFTLVLLTFAGCGEKDTSSTADTVSSEISSEEDGIYPIDTQRNPEEEAAAITNVAAMGNNPKIASEVQLIQDFLPDYAFAHVAKVCVFKDKVYATWSQGICDEDSEGQRIAMSCAPLSDFHSWSSPVVIAEPGDGLLHKQLCMNDLLFTDGKKLYAVYNLRELDASLYAPDGTIIRSVGQELIYMTSEAFVIDSTDGVKWSEPYSLNDCKAYYGEANEYVRYSRTGCTSATVADAKLKGAPLLCETWSYRSANKVIHIMARTNLDKVWQCASFDNGKTWTNAYPTDFNTAATMATFGNLPDGRAFFIGSVTYDVRYPLTMCVSQDGYNFDKGYTLRDEIYNMKKDGWAKGGEFAYPDFAFDDTYMYIVYTKQKETVECTRIKLSDI